MNHCPKPHRITSCLADVCKVDPLVVERCLELEPKLTNLTTGSAEISQKQNIRSMLLHKFNNAW
jgi:hypothetical protein